MNGDLPVTPKKPDSPKMPDRGSPPQTNPNPGSSDPKKGSPSIPVIPEQVGKTVETKVEGRD
ncbi:hypothetical protein QJS10_CPA06g01589 [Acorus calamus]|uniref:Uncharacterized protein n=1 Tax=Acorus calamus TaxID=4465 RepID=A0AAV9EN61_ACOCL|nr:hypothetical protein QJS10_CPA06g01589 [Acorus calamus]